MLIHDNENASNGNIKTYYIRGSDDLEIFFIMQLQLRQLRLT